MNLRDKFNDKIRKAETEVRDLEARLREKKAYLQAFNDSLKLLPREEAEHEVLKPGSSTSRVVEALRAAGRPLHVNEILERMGESPDRKKRASLVGTLSAYVRRKEILRRTGPNKFGLIEWGDSHNEPPEGFGSENPVADKGEKKKLLF